MTTTTTTITPVNAAGRYRTGNLAGISAEGIEAILGFPANVQDDPDKVSHSWGFSIPGHPHLGIWSYKGSESRGQWSTYGPHEAFRELFPAHYQA